MMELVQIELEKICIFSDSAGRDYYFRCNSPFSYFFVQKIFKCVIKAFQKTA